MDQVIDCAVARGDGLGNAQAGLLVADIENVAAEVADGTGRLQFAFQSLQRRRIDVAQRQVGARARHHPRTGPADTASGTGDECRLPRERNHGSSSIGASDRLPGTWVMCGRLLTCRRIEAYRFATCLTS
ncbi:hypothetical protein FQZ97_1063650 [compost metagenome]